MTDPGDSPTPRWAKAVGIVLLVLVLLAVVVLVAGGHGPPAGGH